MVSSNRKAKQDKSNNIDDKRQAILEGALEVFKELGFRQVRIEDIAERAGVAKGTVYLYFGSKEEIFQNLFDVMLENFEKQSQAVDAQDAGSLEDLLASVEEGMHITLKMLEATPQYFEMLAVQAPGQKEKMLARMGGSFRQLAKVYAKKLERLRKTGVIDRDFVIGDFSRVFLSMMDGLLLHCAFFIPDSKTRKKHIATFMKVLEKFLSGNTQN